MRTIICLLLFSIGLNVWAIDRGTMAVGNGVRLQATGRSFADSAGRGWNFSQLEENTQWEFVVVESGAGYHAGDKIWLLPSQFTVVRE